MDFELHVVKGRSASQAIKLTDGVNSVGRQDDCTVRIKSSQVSRKHCEIFETKGKLVVKDLGSANGTFVNGKKVAGQQAVEAGDELTIGGVKLRVARVGEAPAPAASKKPSDTAVVDAIPVGSGGDDEFEIEFDEENAVEAVIVEEVLEVEIDEEPAPPPATASPAKKTSAAAQGPAPKVAPQPEPAPAASEPDNADEAIADFLLDLKIDDED